MRLSGIGPVGRKALRIGLACGTALALGGVASARAPSPVPLPITPVGGQSWLKRLGLTHQMSSMGKMGAMGDVPSSAGAPGAAAEPLGADFLLTGADLYRIDCQSCHNRGGGGLPPEVRSLHDPIRATSPVALREQMARRGVRLDDVTVSQMTAQADAAFRDRLRKGGEKMPPFSHLQAREVDALLVYLKSLAGVPGAAERQIEVTESPLRVGEHLVKGTCFICHDATGPGRDAIAGSPGLVPSLASLLEQDPVAVVVRKVRQGAPAPGMAGNRGEMPVLSYLTAEEVTAAYIYLATYPPAP